MVKNGTFRADLYFRLKSFSIKLVPLRDRDQDINLLTGKFLHKYNIKYSKEMNVSEKAMELIKNYSWPGNVRELSDSIEKLVIIKENKLIQEKDLDFPNKVLSSLTNDAFGKYFDSEDKTFFELLKNNAYEINETAKQINLSRGAVTERFKGICFMLFSSFNANIQDVINNIFKEDIQKNLIEKRINEYYKNLVSVIAEYDDFEAAVSECNRRYKNLPKKYMPFVEKIVEMYFIEKLK